MIVLRNPALNLPSETAKKDTTECNREKNWDWLFGLADLAGSAGVIGSRVAGLAGLTRSWSICCAETISRRGVDKTSYRHKRTDSE